jgi:hypothetical protein
MFPGCGNTTDSRNSPVTKQNLAFIGEVSGDALTCGAVLLQKFHGEVAGGGSMENRTGVGRLRPAISRARSGGRKSQTGQLLP